MKRGQEQRAAYGKLLGHAEKAAQAINLFCPPLPTT